MPRHGAARVGGGEPSPTAGKQEMRRLVHWREPAAVTEVGGADHVSRRIERGGGRHLAERGDFRLKAVRRVADAGIAWANDVGESRFGDRGVIRLGAADAALIRTRKAASSALIAS